MLKNKTKNGVMAILPAHNEEKVIAKTITSLLEQSYKPEEIIIVADNCRDKTVEIAKSFKGVTVFETIGNKTKKAGALNQALKWALKNVCEARYAFIADSDTVMDKEAVWRGISALEADESVGAVCSKAGVLKTSEKGFKNKLMHSLQRIEYAQFDSHRVETQGNIKVLQGMCSIFRVSALREIVKQRGVVFLEDSLVEDYELTLCLKENGWRVISDLGMKAYTEVPLKIGELLVQRQRWLRGGVDALRLHGWNRVTRIEILGHLLFVLLICLRLAAVALAAKHLIVNGFSGFNKLVLLVLMLAFADSLYRMRYIEKIMLRDVLVKIAWLPEMIYGWVQAIILLRSYYLSFTNKKQTW